MLKVYQGLQSFFFFLVDRIEDPGNLTDSLSSPTVSLTDLEKALISLFSFHHI